MNTRRRSFRTVCKGFALLTLLGDLAIAQQISAPSAVPIHFQIAPQPMGRALNEFAAQAQLQLVFVTGDVDAALISPLLTGTYTAQEGLALLLAKSNLHYVFLNERTVSIQVTPRTHAPIEQAVESAPRDASRHHPNR
jgi:hypothetical protein